MPTALAPGSVAPGRIRTCPTAIESGESQFLTRLGPRLGEVSFEIMSVICQSASSDTTSHAAARGGMNPRKCRTW